MNLMEMKKYLITAALAVVVSGSFIGCKDEEFNGSRMEQKVEAFEEAFIRAFGQPDPNHTWGFENLGGDELAMTRTENANANEWADPNKEYGGLLVPPPLTEKQIAVVKAYFQTVDKLGYKDPKWSNYFIQQVYKGNPKTAGDYSPEQYLAADGANYILASDHMDHLLAIDPDRNFVDHINNFNHGDCSTNGTVLDNGGNANDGPFHSDKIMYMKNSTTKSFAYHNSDGSLYHTEYTGLVSWETIDEWAKDNYTGYDGCLDDKWNRSYMGFDFEQIVGDDVYAKVKHVDYSAGWKSEDQYEEGVEYVDGFPVTSVTYTMYEFEGKSYHYLITNRNQYAADKNEKSFIGKYNNKSTTPGIADFNDEPNNDIKRELLQKGYLPVDGTANKTWVKVGGTADGYFSDWIVTLTEAKTSPTPDAPQVYIVSTDTQKQKIEVYKSKQVSQAGRVMCEDLANYADLDDFDYNDIVFDVIIVRETTTAITTPLDGNNQPTGDPVTTTSEDYYANVRLMAAGGTIPAEIKIGSYGYYVVHDVLGKKPTDTMINTLSEGERAKVRGAAVDSVAPVDLTHGNGYKDFYGIRNISDIEVYVKYGNDATRLTPIKGKPSPIFVVPLNTLWAKERSNIADAYKSFNNWVGEEDYAFWSGDRDMTELYQKYQSDGFQTGKDYWILTPTLEEGYPEISVVSSTTTQLLVNATNNTMVVPGNGETKLLDYDPQNPGYLCKSTSTSNSMRVRVPGNSNVNVGDILRIYGVSRTGWLISTNLSSDTYNTYTSDGYIDITITESMLAQVKAGFTISGNSFTVTYVTVRTPNQ